MLSRFDIGLDFAMREFPSARGFFGTSAFVAVPASLIAGPLSGACGGSDDIYRLAREMAEKHVESSCLGSTLSLRERFERVCLN